MKLVLIGYMGVGKSTLGKLIAETFNLSFIDLDNYIENKEQLTIPQLFKLKGEIYFRKVESEALIEILSKKEDYILSLGGGTPVYADNMKRIIEAFDVTSVYVKLNLEELRDRLFQQKESRPVIAHLSSKSDFDDFLRKHLFERQQFYFMADHVLNVTGKGVSKSLDELTSLLNQNI
jgi:shikimate kinase